MRIIASSTDPSAGASIAFAPDGGGGDGWLAVGAPDSNSATGRAFVLQNPGI